jgi:hypothetical protein
MNIARCTMAIAMALVLVAAHASADEPEKRSVGGWVAYVTVVEVAISLNAGIASAAPRAYGIAAAVLFPLAAMNHSGGNESRSARVVALVACEALAAYDIFVVDPESDSGQQIFVANVIGFHAAIAATIITERLTRNRTGQVSTRFEPLPEGAALALSHGF